MNARVIFSFEEDFLARATEAQEVMRVYFESKKRPQDYYLAVRDLEKFLENRSMSAKLNLTPLQAVQYITWCRNQVGAIGNVSSSKFRSDGTVHKYSCILRSLYNKWLQAGIIKVNPWHSADCRRHGRVKRHRDRLTTDQVKALFAVTDNSIFGYRDRAIMALLFGSGLRISEALNLKVADIHDGYVWLSDQKSRRSSKVATAPWVSVYMKEWIEKASPSSWVFFRMWGAYCQRDERAGVKAFNRSLKRYAKEIGIKPEDISSHSGRITLISELMDRGYDIYSIRNAVRHSSVKVTEGYIRKEMEVKDSPLAEINYNLSEGKEDAKTNQP